MDCDIKNFYISTINAITYIDEKIYPNNYVEYRPYLHYEELIFFKDTIATVNFNEFIFHVEPNDILFLPCGQQQKYSIQFQKQGAFMDIHFASNIHLNSTAILYKGLPSNTYINFQHMLSSWQENPTRNHAKCMSLLWDLIYKIQNSLHLPKAQYKLIEPAVDFIENHYLDPQIPIEKLARQCGISYSLFLKIFEQQFSTTPKNYIIKLKMNAACEFLKTDKTITQISEALGFTDVYFFSKQFKKYMNISPTEYRKKFLQNLEFFNYVKPWEKT